ncbi:MAG: DNA-binding protein [Mangrovibacterium sp.]
MERKITFNELRKIKDSLPDGTIRQLANEFNMDVETVRNYFGGANYDRGKSVGLHLEPGPNGGVVLLDDTQILQRAEELIKELH